MNNTAGAMAKASGRLAPLLLATLIAGTVHAMPPHKATRADSPAQIALGRTLFFDQRLSVNGTLSCATCHDRSLAYADGRSVAANRSGANNANGHRNTPSLLNSAHYTRWSASGNHDMLATQVLEPLFSESEHGFRSERDITTRVRDTPEFAAAYRTAFGANAPFTLNRIAESLAAFVRSLASAPPILDGLRNTGDSRVDARVAAGRALFSGKAQCASCHVPQQFFTDNRFHLAARGAVAIDASTLAAMNQARLRVGEAKYQRAASADVSRLGAFAATLDPADVGKFRTPSLLHVARTAPYFHDGSVASLRDAIMLEAARNPQAQLSTTELDELLEYVRSLGSREP
jgi:cytochrome c peroxidase